MANYTENYNLIMPAQEDYYNVQEFNDNMEAIDTGMAELAAEVSGIGTKLDALSAKLTALDGKVGTQEDTGTNTIYGLLKNGTKIFKSWNRYVYSNTASTTSGTVPIQQVDHTRCIVLAERISNNNDNILYYDYTLTDTSINVVHGGLNITGMLRLAFTVVELY